MLQGRSKGKISKGNSQTEPGTQESISGLSEVTDTKDSILNVSGQCFAGRQTSEPRVVQEAPLSSWRVA